MLLAPALVALALVAQALVAPALEAPALLPDAPPLLLARPSIRFCTTNSSFVHSYKKSDLQKRYAHVAPTHATHASAHTRRTRRKISRQTVK